MSIKNIIYEYINRKFEKKFLSDLTLKLKNDDIAQFSYLIEEITQKTPLIYESYVQNNKPSDRKEVMHLRIASFILSIFSSLRICYKDKEDLIKLINEISSNIFYKETKLLLKLSFLFSKNKLIAIWNYFFLLSKSFSNLFFDKAIELDKDYENEKIVLIFKPLIYVKFFQKHKSEFLVSSSISFLDSIVKIADREKKDLIIDKEEDNTNFIYKFYITIGNNSIRVNNEK